MKKELSIKKSVPVLISIKIANSFVIRVITYRININGNKLNLLVVKISTSVVLVILKNIKKFKKIVAINIYS